jgi:hypothetical protein
MNRRLAIRVLLGILMIAGPTGLGLPECRAGTSIQDLLDNSNGKVTYGGLTFTFTASSVSSDPAGNPTAAQIDVSQVTNGIMFDFNPMLSLTTANASTQTVTITYSVTATYNVTTAGLSFSGTAVDISTRSQVTETVAGGNDMTVYVNQDGDGNTTRQTSQSVSLDPPAKTLAVTDVGTLTVPTRGGGATSTAQLYSIVNTFSVPEPSSLVTGSIAVLVGLGAWWRTRRLAG